MSIIAIPKTITGQEELIIISRKEYEELLANKKKQFEENCLCLSKEAKKLKKEGKLPVLRSLKSL